MPGAEVGEAFLCGEDGMGWEEAAIRQQAREAGAVPGPFRCTGPKAPRSGAGSPPHHSSVSNITGSSGLFYFFKQITLLKLVISGCAGSSMLCAGFL